MSDHASESYEQAILRLEADNATLLSEVVSLQSRLLETVGLREALEFYAYHDNWRSSNDTQSFLTWLDPEFVPTYLTGRDISGIKCGWEVAEHALRDGAPATTTEAREPTDG